MKFRRQLGLTLMEVLVAVTVIMVIAAITFVGLRAWRDHSLQVACMQKLSRLNEALMAYRAEWGNPHEVVGSVVSLGLPLRREPARMWIGRNSWVEVVDYSFNPEQLLRLGRTEEERSEIFTCPVLRRRFPETYVLYGYWPALRWFADEERGLFPYSSVTAVLQGASPVLECLSHHGPKTVWKDRSETYPMIVLSLDGRVNLEFITGLLLTRHQWSPYFYDEKEYLTYIRQRNPEGFDKEMKLLQSRRGNRR
jgi:hypothetical protein